MMYTQLLAFTLLAVSQVSFAAPTESKFARRQSQVYSSLSPNDASVLELALFLEHLEFNFYTGGYENFTDDQYSQYSFPKGFRDGIGITAQQEGVHIDTLTQVLETNGLTPVPNCTYNFPYSNPKEFVELANMITTVGIGAYLGGALSLMDNRMLLTEAASILSIEARHNSFLRAGLVSSPFPSPFDTGLTAVWAYNLALMFIESCPMYLPLIELPQLIVVNPPAPIDPPPPPPAENDPVTPPTATIQFKWDPSKYFVPVDPTKPLYIAFVNMQQTIYEVVTSCGVGCGTVPSPAAASGVAFAALTTFDGGMNEQGLSDHGTLAGPAEVVLG